uniref:Uncharacterized protein n=1 Tax=Panagrolaimus davidi TaxID=227884 RepID=A0A914PN20_9BILA
MFNETWNGAANNGDLPEIQPIDFILIENFPTQNYAQNFFCLDPLYGTFVSFFWNHDPSSPPEAHYYSIDESNLKNFEMIDKIILKDFDLNVLKDIFENRFDKRYLPIFESYGRQIFIRFVYPKEDPEDNDHRTIFSGLWKNENEKDVKKFVAKVIWSPSQRLNAYDMNVVFRAKKSWIQKFRPYVPPTTTKPPTAVPTTTSPTIATTVPKTTMPPFPPGTAPPKQTSPLESTSIIDSSTASSTSTTTTSSKNSGTNNDTNSSQTHPTPAASHSEDSSKASFIILVILIICKFRGAKKMKEEMAKKNVEKSGKKKPQSSEAKEIMPKKKPPKMKKQKKSSVKKSKDTGKKTATTTTTFDQTNYFTVNDTFEKNTK